MCFYVFIVCFCVLHTVRIQSIKRRPWAALLWGDLQPGSRLKLAETPASNGTPHATSSNKNRTKSTALTDASEELDTERGEDEEEQEEE